jgi:hypothetical protein
VKWLKWSPWVQTPVPKTKKERNNPNFLPDSQHLLLLSPSALPPSSDLLLLVNRAPGPVTALCLCICCSLCLECPLLVFQLCNTVYS